MRCMIFGGDPVLGSPFHFNASRVSDAHRGLTHGLLGEPQYAAIASSILAMKLSKRLCLECSTCAMPFNPSLTAYITPLFQRSPVILVTRGQHETQQLASPVADLVQLDAEEPSHRVFPSLNYALEYLMICILWFLHTLRCVL